MIFSMKKSLICQETNQKHSQDLILFLKEVKTK